MTASVAKTLHPLPFENLEPKRFEDLVRQLVYDFRPWRAIEATGRSGSDEGFDARAYENISAGVAAEGREEADEDVTGYPPAARVWLIQCKREKSIGPSKIKKHLDAIPPASIAQSYGVLFAAACDFSKATRDACRDWCRHRGIQEVHIWGKAELEDQLYQPKNDNLLFAYFGISLQVRRRSLTTEVRRTTAIKRKIKRHLEEEGAWPGKPFIVRDPTDQRYPYTEGKGLSSGGLLWQPYHSRGIGVNGLRVLKRCHHGYLDHSTGDWDIASGLDRSFPMEAERLWGVRTDKDEEIAQAVIGRWSKLPRGSQVFLMFEAILPYDEILEIDELGDDVCGLPTVFAEFREGVPPLDSRWVIYWEASAYRQQFPWSPEHHVRLFADEHRDLQWEAGWSERNGVTIATEVRPFPENDAA